MIPERPSSATSTSSGRWYILAVLTLLVVLSYIDRMALSLLITPIKADLGLSDTQISYLLGLAFALFYGLVSIPAGYLVDTFPRQRLLFGAVGLWTLMTAAGGFATAFVPLLICRAGVGLGEAVLAPGAYSLINQLFEGKQRSRAFTIFSIGNAIGGGVAIALVGLLLHWLQGDPLKALGILPAWRPWQLVLLLLGVVGLPLSLLLLTFREPARPAFGRREGTTVREAFSHFATAPGDYIPLYCANFLIGVAVFGGGAWIPTMIQRLWGLPIARIGETYGVIQIVTSLTGLLATGIILERLERRNGRAAIPFAGFVALAVAGAALTAAPFMPTIGGTWAMLAIMLLMLPCAPVINALILSRLTPARMMGRYSALAFLVVSAFGTAVGPTLIAALGSTFGVGPHALGLGVALGAGVPLVGSGLLYLWLALRNVRVPATGVVQ